MSFNFKPLADPDHEKKFIDRKALEAIKQAYSLTKQGVTSALHELGIAASRDNIDMLIQLSLEENINRLTELPPELAAAGRKLARAEYHKIVRDFARRMDLPEILQSGGGGGGDDDSGPGRGRGRGRAGRKKGKLK
jgi:hypothetical protein